MIDGGVEREVCPHVVNKEEELIGRPTDGKCNDNDEEGITQFLGRLQLPDFLSSG